MAFRKQIVRFLPRRWNHQNALKATLGQRLADLPHQSDKKLVIDAGRQLGPNLEHDAVETVPPDGVHDEPGSDGAFLAVRQQLGEVLVGELVKQDARDDWGESIRA